MGKQETEMLKRDTAILGRSLNPFDPTLRRAGAAMRATAAE